MVAVELILQIIYISIQILQEIMQSDIGIAFRNWYKNNPLPSSKK